jgi:hypothetical protein
MERPSSKLRCRGSVPSRTVAVFVLALSLWAAAVSARAAVSRSITVTTAQFNGVSCFAFNACVGVGYWKPDERAAQQHFAARWNGHAWTLLATPAGHAPSYLYSADCVVRLCVLVGEWTDSSGDSCHSRRHGAKPG